MKLQLYILVCIAFFTFYKPATGQTAQFPYKTEWNKVKNLYNDERPKTGRNRVLRILKNARQDKRSVDIIRAVLLIEHFNSEIEPNSDSVNIRFLLDEIKTACEPAKSFLEMELARQYSSFNNYNSYRISHITPLEHPTNDSDIYVWDKAQFKKAILRWGIASLSQKDLLQNTLVRDYKSILDTGQGSAEVWPTLYDLIAHRVINLFWQDDRDVVYSAIDSIPVQHYRDFISWPLEKQPWYNDSTYFPQNLKIFQDLEKFHAARKNAEALIDIDVMQLQFVKAGTESQTASEDFYKALRVLEKEFEGSPASAEAGFQIAQYLNSSGHAKPKDINGPSNQAALDICNAYINKYPKSIGAYNCSVLKARILAVNFSPGTDVYHLPGKLLKLWLRYKNIHKCYYRIAFLSDKELKHEEKRDFDSKQRLKRYLTLPVSSTGTWDLIPTADYENKDTSMYLPAQRYGHYVILMSENEKFSINGGLHYFRVNITALKPMIIKSASDHKPRLYVMNADNGAYVSDAVIQITHRYGKKKVFTQEGKTGADGYIDLDTSFTATRQYRNYMEFNIIVTKDSDKITTSYSWSPERYTAPNHDTAISISFFTDRAIYRPGQKVYYKGIVTSVVGHNMDNKVVPGYKTIVYFKDVNYQVIDSQKVVSNGFGSFAGQFTVPVSVLNGTMKLSAEKGSANLRVEEYKRPKFEAGFSPLHGLFRINDSIKAGGYALSYAGANIDQARVSYSITASNTGKKLILKTGEIITDASGHFIIPFKAIPFKTWRGDGHIYKYDIAASVVDQTGETQAILETITVTDKVVEISVNAPDWVDNTRDLEIRINAMNMAAMPIKIKGTLNITKIKEPTKAEEPPYTSYKAESVQAPEEKIYISQLAVSGIPVSIDAEKLADLPQGQYLVAFSAKDSFGNDVYAKTSFILFNQESGQLATNRSYYFIAAKHGSVEPGKKAQFIWGSANRAFCHLVGEHEGKIVFKKTVEANNSQTIIDIPIMEAYRGGLKIIAFSSVNGNNFTEENNIDVPFTSRELEITSSVFHSTLEPGQKETWKFTIKGPQAEKVGAEMMATLYDASLDAFERQNYYFGFYPYVFNTLDYATLLRQNFDRFDYFNNKPERDNNSYKNREYDAIDFMGSQKKTAEWDWNVGFVDRYDHSQKRKWRKINCPDNFGGRTGFSRGNSGAYSAEDASDFNTFRGNGIQNFNKKSNYDGKKPISIVSLDKMGKSTAYDTYDSVSVGGEPAEYGDVGKIIPRKNLQELAFFYPQLSTNDSGQIEISFIIPEALTKWSFIALAHTKDLMTAVIQKYAVTQKTLMVQPNAPRFLRETDIINFTTKVTNMSADAQDAVVTLQLLDPNTNKPLTNTFVDVHTLTQKVHIGAKQSQSISWRLGAPRGLEGIMYRVLAATPKFSDGEEGIIPILPIRIMLTEAMPIYVKNGQTKEFIFKSLLNYTAAEKLDPYLVTMEMTSNPAWYAVQALPYLMEFPHECSEQLFERVYANSLARHIVNKEPKIKEVFQSWKKGDGKTLQSPLEKNQDVKNILLAETPWVRDAENETDRKKRVGLLFSDSAVDVGLANAMDKLEKNQLENGSWPWFPGMDGDEYITAYICRGIGRLESMGVSTVYTERLQVMQHKALGYLDREMANDYLDIIKSGGKLTEDNLSPEIVTYLYARSFWNAPVDLKYAIAYDYWWNQAARYGKFQRLPEMAMLVSALKRKGRADAAAAIWTAIDERALHSDEMGMYWKYNLGGPGLREEPEQAQAVLIEAYTAMGTANRTAVEDMKLWLLKQKQTHNWSTTTATADAVYALLLEGNNPLTSDVPVQVTMGNETIKPGTDIEKGTGYFQHAWQADAISPALGHIKLEKKDDGVAWGAVYFQYYQDLDKVIAAPGKVWIAKTVYLQTNTRQGLVLESVGRQTVLKTGDLVKIRLEISLDRDMEYMHLKDLRAGAFEPVEQLSGYKYQQGLGYYQDIKDASINFFFDHIPKGTYVFEYNLRVTQSGTFQNGIATMENMYAPEFNSHSEGAVVTVK